MALLCCCRRLPQEEGSMDLESLMGSLGPMKEAMDKASNERSDKVFSGTAGGGAVKIALRGDLTVESVEIAAAAASASEDDVSMLEDLVGVAMNDALRQYAVEFGATPEEQIQKSLASSDLGSMLGPLMGGLG